MGIRLYTRKLPFDSHMMRRISFEYSCDRRRRIHWKHLLGGVARPRPSRDCPGQSSGRASRGRAAVSRFVEADLADRQQIEKVFATHKIHAVMHFAGEALVAKSVREPSTFYAANVGCGVNLLDAMVRHGVDKLIFSSTAATYGEPEVVPIPEDHRQAPINPYGKSKLRFEQILADYRAYTGLKYVTVRYFNAAGASKERGENHRVETHLIPRALDTALGRFPEMEIFGFDYPTPDGTCVRDFVHVLDIADSHLLALEEIDRVHGESFNVGTTSGYSNLQVVQAAERITAAKCRTSFLPGDRETPRL